MSRHVAVLLLALAGCDPDPNDAYSDAGTTTTDAAIDATPLPTKRGWLDVQLIVPAFDSIDPETLIEGAFVATPACEYKTIGACEVRWCNVGAAETLAAPGKLHVGFPGGSEFGWDPGAFPVSFRADAIPWAAGETISVRGDGEDVPAFSLSVPSPKTLNAGFDGPIFDATMTRTQPLAIQWPATAGDVVITIRQDSRSDRPRTTIACAYPAAAGSTEIPASVLAHLSPTSSSFGDTDVRAWLASTATVTAGDYSIRLRALRGWSDQYTSYKVQ